MYKITDYTMKKADKLGLMVKPSTKKNKKIDVFTKDNKYLASVGALNYKDYPTYLLENGPEIANQRRYLFHKRFKNRANETYSNSYYALNLLW